LLPDSCGEAFAVNDNWGIVANKKNSINIFSFIITPNNNLRFVCLAMPALEDLGVSSLGFCLD
ncbi:MAG: hypothetical protein ABR542_09590, partial [Desulfonatronovibrio sp.]